MDLSSPLGGQGASIRWTVYGKINRIVKNSGSTIIDYGYDPGGNRTYKKVKVEDTITTTFYIRDAQGNVMGIYTRKDEESIKWSEQHLYGSSRLGIWKWGAEVPSAPPVVIEEAIFDSLMFGMRQYELSNHLGNVLATISDKKTGNDSSGVVNYYVVEVLSQNDYYPFGMGVPDRSYNVNDDYRYGFNGKENDNEVKGEGKQQDYGMRIYDMRLGRFLSIDPLSQKFPFFSPYQFAGNDVMRNVDLDGAEKMPYGDLPKNSSGTIVNVINHINVFEFTENGNKYKVAEYGTKFYDKGPFGLREYSREIYMVQDVNFENTSDYDVGDGTVIRSEGTNWHFWKTSNERSRAGKVTDELVRKTGIAVFGAAAVGAAVPAVSSLGSTYLGSKFVSTGIDFTSQMITNGGNINDINLTSLTASFVFNSTASFKGLLLKNTIANGLQVNSNLEYKGFLGNNVDNANVLLNIGVGTILDKGVSSLQNINSGVTPAALGRWQNLSYKPKFSSMLLKYQTNQRVSNFFNSYSGQTAVGVVGNVLSKNVQSKNP